MSRTIGMGTVKPIENNAEIEALQAENTKLIEENKVLKAENKKLKKE